MAGSNSAPVLEDKVTAMNIRILNIRGAGKTARAQQLQHVTAWMEARGWQLMDYAESSGSAAFERAADAPRLGWLDPTRWLSGPDWFRPRSWLGSGMASPRELILAGAVCVVVAAVFLGVLSYSYSGPSSLIKGGADARNETWLYVNANTLNVRASPVSEAQIVGVLYRNQKVLVDQTNEGWARIVQPEKGFVAARFLKPYPVQ